MTNLKQVLMELGNRLVTEKKFNPAHSSEPPSTQPIDDFARWLNETPDARQILAEMGVEWPVVEKLALTSEQQSGKWGVYKNGVCSCCGRPR